MAEGPGDRPGQPEVAPYAEGHRMPMALLVLLRETSEL